MIFFIVIGFITFVLPQYTVIEQETLVGYVLVFLFLQGPLEVIMSSAPELAKTMVSLKKIKTLGLNLNATEENQHPTLIEKTRIETDYANTIELKQVKHSYYRETEDSHFELGPIDLSFKRGEVVFLIGGNGSGKTTLAKLLLGLYQPSHGEIVVDGRVIDEASYDNYRQLFSAVFVDFYLFDELLGFHGVDLDKQAQEYINKLQLGHKVTVEKGRLSTTNLSQGQRKRLTLLAAYLEDRQFYVFDEWAADQDPEFKRFFYTDILSDLKERGKTVLVISHDEQFFHVADRYIKMDFGQVVVTDKASELYA
jgi:putative ATP-binding cassette transporter